LSASLRVPDGSGYLHSVGTVHNEVIACIGEVVAAVPLLKSQRRSRSREYNRPRLGSGAVLKRDVSSSGHSERDSCDGNSSGCGSRNHRVIPTGGEVNSSYFVALS